ncbi:hypothetical protein C8R47DRAFT_807425 [Mycena vitilis]|nr:hypothetical protein C8R47DRAFT_807425 [Mycena vitilis]
MFVRASQYDQLRGLSQSPRVLLLWTAGLVSHALRTTAASTMARPRWRDPGPVPSPCGRDEAHLGLPVDDGTGAWLETPRPRRNARRWSSVSGHPLAEHDDSRKQHPHDLLPKTASLYYVTRPALGTASVSSIYYSPAANVRASALCHLSSRNKPSAPERPQAQSRSFLVPAHAPARSCSLLPRPTTCWRFGCPHRRGDCPGPEGRASRKATPWCRCLRPRTVVPISMAPCLFVHLLRDGKATRLQSLPTTRVHDPQSRKGCRQTTKARCSARSQIRHARVECREKPRLQPHEFTPEGVWQGRRGVHAFRIRETLATQSDALVLRALVDARSAVYPGRNNWRERWGRCSERGWAYVVITRRGWDRFIVLQTTILSDLECRRNRRDAFFHPTGYYVHCPRNAQCTRDK